MMPAITVTTARAMVAAGLAAHTSRPTRGRAIKVPRTELRISFQRSRRFLGLSGSGTSSTTGGPLMPLLEASVSSGVGPAPLGSVPPGVLRFIYTVNYRIFELLPHRPNRQDSEPRSHRHSQAICFSPAVCQGESVSSLRSMVRSRPRAVVAGVAMSAMALAACGIGPGASGQSPSAKSPSPSVATGVAADRKRAASANLTLADISTGFAKVDESFSTTTQLSTNAACIKAPATLFTSTARHSRDFSFHLDAKQREAGHVTSLVTVGASANENAQNFAVISSDAYVSCVATSLNDFVAAATAQVLGTVSVARSTAYPT